MKLKLNIAFVVMIVLIGWKFCSGLNTGYQAFMAGLNEGYSSDGKLSYYFMDLIPNNYLEQDSLYNTKTGEYEKIAYVTKNVMVSRAKEEDDLTLPNTLGVAVFPLMIAFWVCFIKVIFSVNRNEKIIFTTKLEKRLTRCAIYLGIFSLVNMICEHIEAAVCQNNFEFEGMFIETDYSNYIMLFISAAGFVMVSEIFRIARKLKEEQELTI